MLFQARFLLSKVNPSQTHNNMYASAWGQQVGSSCSLLSSVVSALKCNTAMISSVCQSRVLTAVMCLLTMCCWLYVLSAVTKP